VHVTHFNALFWDGGSTEVRVIEHGIVDPGYRYTGERRAAAVVVNEPLRRGRVTGTDLLPTFAEVAPLDVFGMEVDDLRRGPRLDHVSAYEDLSQAELHEALPRRRLYLHPLRWTSLGLSLIEAMHLGLPVVALDTTEASEAVPPTAGVVSNRPDVLRSAVRHYLHEPEAAVLAGLCAREAARARYGLERFLADWDVLLKEVAS